MTTLSTAHFELAVDLERGAKITSLKDSTGYEWLAQAVPGAVPVAGTKFTDAEMSGWDECAPTIEECLVDGVQIPDHGDVWDQEFTGSAAHAHIKRDELGFTFERSITEVAEGIHLSYRATALRERVPFLWAAHPQFSAPPGTRVELGECLIVDIWEPVSEPRPPQAADATIDTLSDGQCRKWYVSPAEPVFAASLVKADGRSLDLSWSASCPYVGVWFDHALHSREPVIAIEPSIGYYDSLDRAVALDRVAYLAPREPLEWWVEIRATHK